MPASQLSEVIQYFRRTVLLRDGAGPTDGQLLEDYLSRHEESALATLVHRHGPMVWGVCRRLLRNYHDAEDAFQATFLVLVRKAHCIVPKGMIANWLYGVAHQTALKARATTAKRRARERQVVMPEPAVTGPDLWNDLQPLLDQELSRLPDKYRVAIVLCDLEGKTRKEAARQLGVPEGTLAARVSRGRLMLAKRLVRHGLVVSGGTLGLMLAQKVAPAGVPTLVVSNTVKAASVFAAGQAAAPGVISLDVAALTEGVLKSMLLSKLKVALVVMLTMGALGIGTSALPYGTTAEPPSVASKSVVPEQDKGNLQETLLALENHIWEAHAKQNVDTFKNLLADDFVGIDMFGRSYDKAGELDYVVKFRVIEHTMKDVKVIALSPTSALVSYAIDYKVRPTGGQNVESTTRRVTSAWARRKGRWWYVYFEDRPVQREGATLRLDLRTPEQVQDLSEILKKINAEKNPPKD
jgi:RNA polymerase sigma factor (sigma-70 family)